MKSIRYIFLFGGFLFFNIKLNAQQANIKFTKSKTIYLRGESQLIGNTILSKHKTKPFKNQEALNDNIKMVYVDVDNDPSTFSSSQAVLVLPESVKKIKYASLYWSATYPFNRGVKKVVNRKIVFRGKGQRDSVSNQVKFKIGNSSYKTIKGQYLYNAHYSSEKTNFHATTKPYVCFFDVTKQLQRLKPGKTPITVANIRATQGNISGGSASGWALYVVYEDPNETAKYFSSYHGFQFIDKKTPVILEFNDFKTIKQGPVNASISVVALEGDATLKKDVCAIKKANSNSFVALMDAYRKPANFFNSTIRGLEKEIERKPMNINTLGFDIAHLKIKNNNNEILSNNLSQTQLKLSTKKDRFYLFFTAFEIEVPEKFYLNKKVDVIVKSPNITIEENPLTPIQSKVIKPLKKEVLQKENKDSLSRVSSNSTPVYSANKNTDYTVKKEGDSTTQKEVLNNDKPKKITKKTRQQNFKPNNTTTGNSTRKHNIEKKKIAPKTYSKSKLNPSNQKKRTIKKHSIARPYAVIKDVNLTKGFYVITNVFSISENVKKWKNSLIEDGYSAKSFYRSSNNLYYVYAFRTELAIEALKTYRKLRKQVKYKDTWILKIE